MDFENIITLTEKEFSSLDAQDTATCVLPHFVSSEPIKIETVEDAQRLATHLGNLVDAKMTQLKQTTDDASREKLMNSIKWIHKKATVHPAEVLDAANAFDGDETFFAPLEKIGVSRQKAFNDLKILCILHDVGRLGEMDMKTGLIVKLHLFKGKGYDHSFESAAILSGLGLKTPEILLPIKYHGVSDFVGRIHEDDLFKTLSKEKQQQILAYGSALQDCDRYGNLIPKSITGIKGCSELYNPAYVGNYRVTENVIQRLCDSTVTLVKEEKTYLDAMIRWVSWSNLISCDCMKKSVAHLLNGLWDRIFEEAEEEYQNATDKNPLDYASTLESLLRARQANMKAMHSEELLTAEMIQSVNDKIALLKK